MNCIRKQISCDYEEYRKKDSKKKKMSDNKKHERFSISQKRSYTEEYLVTKTEHSGSLCQGKRTSSSIDTPLGSSKLLKFHDTKEKSQNSSCSSSDIALKKEVKPFKFSFLSTDKGSNNTPLFSAKEKKEQKRQEDEIRHVLKAKRHLSELPHRKCESSSVCTKEQGMYHKSNCNKDIVQITLPKTFF